MSLGIKVYQGRHKRVLNRSFGCANKGFCWDLPEILERHKPQWFRVQSARALAVGLGDAASLIFKNRGEPPHEAWPAVDAGNVEIYGV